MDASPDDLARRDRVIHHFAGQTTLQERMEWLARQQEESMRQLHGNPEASAELMKRNIRKRVIQDGQ